MLVSLFSITLLCCYENPARDNPDDPYNWDIIYPETGYYGDNILNEEELTPTPNTDYSLRLNIVGDHSVRVTIPNNIDWDRFHQIGWIPVNNDNWDYIVFYADDGSGLYDCRIRFLDEVFSANEIRIYENNSTAPTRVKEITLKGDSPQKGGDDDE